jgi:uncharacterized hydrophobic protein (TIGR00271 family)
VTALATPTRESQREAIRANAVLDVPFLSMNTLATVIASYGLLADSPAVIIGAMIIAMLLGPIGGAALALVDGDHRLLGKSLTTLVVGAAGVALTAFVLGFIHRDIPITHEILARTSPNSTDLMIALAGGAAGAYATVSTRLSVAFVGVAIATALVPPICAGSILFARGEYQLGLGAWFLAFINMCAIQFAFSVVLWLNGFRGLAPASGLNLTGFLRRNLVSLAILAVLAVVLVANLHKVVGEELFESSLRSVLGQAIEKRPGNYLAEVRVSREGADTVVRAVVRGPSPPSPADVAALAGLLPPSPSKTPIDLRVRFVQTVTITPKGIISEPSVPVPGE